MDTAPIVAERPDDKKRPPGRKRRLKSLADLDRRTAAAKTAFALRDQIILDLGGEASLSAMKRVLVDKVAILEASLNNLAAAYLAGEAVEMIRFATLANAQRRLLADLGLERRAHDITPDLRDYIKEAAP
jgi:hypothetical protein